MTDQREPEPPANAAGADARRSGLRNPVAAARGLGAGTLVLETIVLLLAIQPMRMLGGDLSGATIGVIVAAAVACVALAGLLRRDWAWYAAAALQGVLMLAGFLHWGLAGVGLLFGLAWLYVLSVRRTILAPPKRDQPRP
ncbi:DUF4233 domain-containing protein [Phytohabitans sp. ZYX-F-186]|uniref:DUF4233 domain-containing protein n=1 Tax=Phytohabitans maris TaxID=3071409 RepID=A0ABU0ZWN1_9ACTN|nr:DUF4233 domain-containing protein [Phytohabitans sp. ZYX-F-186]MDQ7911446.1 DUF4233 domain-containing protein [Phytohabitans sp. ZYX-F-186]